MAPTDKFNFYLNMYKQLNPSVGAGVNALDGFLQFVKRRFPSFYNQAEAQVREMTKQIKPEAPSENTKQTSGKSGTYKATNPKQVEQAKANKQIDKLYKSTSAQGLKDQFSKVTNGAGKVFNNVADTASKTAKTVSNVKPQNVGGIVKGVGNKLYQAAVPLTYGAGMIQNWNAPGSDWRTRGLDLLGTGEAIVDSALASLIPNPVAGFGVGTLGAARAAANKGGIQNIREQNVANTVNSVKDLSPEEQDAYNKYLATGQGGQLHPNFVKGVEGSSLPSNYENPEEFMKKNNINLDSNPPITTLPGLPQTSATGTEPPRQVITGDGNVVNARANGGGNYTPTFTPIGNTENGDGGNFVNNVINRANNMTVDEARAGMEQPQNIAGAASNMNATTDAMINRLMDTEGYVTPQQMQDLIRKEYESIRNVNAQNPYYGGEYIQPGGYNVDPAAVRRLAYADYLSGGAQNNAQRYLDMQRINYNTEMANRAGVPYEDYVKGMSERNANEVLIRAKEVEQQLTNYANQTNDMKVKLQVAQALQINRQNAQNKLDEIYAQANADIGLQRLKNEGDIQKQYVANAGNLANTQAQGVNTLTNTMYSLNHPTKAMTSTANLLEALALVGYNNPSLTQNLLSVLNPNIHRAMFGKVMNPNDINDVFQVQQMMQQNPSIFQQFLNMYNGLNRGNQ